MASDLDVLGPIRWKKQCIPNTSSNLGVESKPDVLLIHEEYSSTAATLSEWLMEKHKTKTSSYGPAGKNLCVGRPVFDYITLIAFTEREEPEVAYFIVVISCRFKKVHGMFFGMHGLASLRENIRHFSFLRLINVLEDFVYCVYQFFVGRTAVLQESWQHTFKYGKHSIKHMIFYSWSKRGTTLLTSDWITALVLSHIHFQNTPRLQE